MNNDPSRATNPHPASDQSFLPLFIALCLAALLFPISEYVPYLFTIVASVALLAGMMAVQKDHMFRLLAGIVLCLSLPLRWSSHFWGDQLPWIALVSHILAGIYFAILEAYVIVQVMAYRRITRQTLIGAVCGYLLIGVIFTFAFAVLTSLFPEAIQVNGKPIGQERAANVEAHVAELIYFSFVTLSTVGYGDIIPVSPVARSLVIVEALSGQLYLAAFVARLVGLMSSTPSDVDSV